MSDPERDKLDELGARIRQAKGEKLPADEAVASSGDLAKAGRIGFDFVATISVCIVLGWLVDRELGSKPWGFLTGLLAGFVTGIANLWRALGNQGQAVGWQSKDEEKKGETKK